MYSCYRCGRELSKDKNEDIVYCPFCGAKQRGVDGKAPDASPDKAVLEYSDPSVIFSPAQPKAAYLDKSAAASPALQNQPAAGSAGQAAIIQPATAQAGQLDSQQSSQPPNQPSAQAALSPEKKKIIISGKAVQQAVMWLIMIAVAAAFFYLAAKYWNEFSSWLP
jgi:hypothetical protein